MHSKGGGPKNNLLNYLIKIKRLSFKCYGLEIKLKLSPIFKLDIFHLNSCVLRSLTFVVQHTKISPTLTYSVHLYIFQRWPMHENT